MLKSKLLFAIMILALAGCALSPQVITVQPQIDFTKFNSIGNGKRVALQVVDNRPNRVIGSRGGIYADTSSISTDNDIASPIKASVAEALERLGFNVVERGREHDAELRLLVDAIEYDTRGETMVRGVETAATLRAVSKVGTREFTGRYRATKSKDVVKAPTPEDNEELINGALSRVLERALADQALLEFLRDG